MPVEIIIPQRLSRYADGQRNFQVQPGTLQEMLQLLCRRHPELRLRLLGEADQLHPYFAVLLNQQTSSAEDAATISCRDGDRLEIVTLASGG